MVEEKFKRSLLGLEKRIIDLEATLSEIETKLKETDLKRLSEKIEELEDISMVNVVSLTDLKKVVEQKKVELKKEDLDQIFKNLEPLVLSKVESLLKSLKSQLNTLKNEFEEKFEILKPVEIREKLNWFETEIQRLVENYEKGLRELRSKIESLRSELKGKIEVLDLQEAKAKIGLFSEQIDKLSSNLEETSNRILGLRGDLENLRKKLSEISEKEVKKLVSEVASLRNEFNRETRLIKEQVENLSAKTSEIDLTLLASKFNTLKDSVDYLLNRKVEFDMKLKALEEAVTKLLGMEFPGKLSENLTNLIQRLDKIENRLKLLEARSGLIAKPLTDKKITELIEKINLLESKLIALEQTRGKAPIILE